MLITSRLIGMFLPKRASWTLSVPFPGYTALGGASFLGLQIPLQVDSAPLVGNQEASGTHKTHHPFSDQKMEMDQIWPRERKDKLTGPVRWKSCNFSASIRQALQEGLNPNTFWTEADLVLPPFTGPGGCVVLAPEDDEVEDGTWLHWNTPSHRAVWVYDFRTIEQLLELGADINSCNAIGLTPLHEAVRSRKPGPAALLLRHGANPDS